MADFYNAKCPHCGQIDVVYAGQKTHKCSSCGNRNKLDYNNPTINCGKAEDSCGISFLQVICPYCGYVDIVPVREQRHTCSACRGLYEVINNNGITKSGEIAFKTNQQNNPFSNANGKNLFWSIIIVSAIIVGIVSLCSKFSNDSMPTSRDSAVMIGVMSYLRENLKDPNSYQEIEWSPSGIDEKGLYYIRHKYRAKNSFGGYVIEEKIFYLDKSYKVVETQNYFGT